jgi:hypothetical protein
MTTLKNTSTNESIPVWYKQFWPWFLIILPGTVVIASICTVILAFMRADTLVNDNYYKEGLAINKTFSDIHAAQRMNIEGVLIIQNNAVQLSLASEKPLADDTLLLTFNHPFNKELDATITLSKEGHQKFTGTIPNLEAGKWYVTLQSSNTKSSWRISSTQFLPKNTLTLRPE